MFSVAADRLVLLLFLVGMMCFLLCVGHVARFTFLWFGSCFGLWVCLRVRGGVLFASVCGLCSAGIAFLVGFACLF